MSAGMSNENHIERALRRGAAMADLEGDPAAGAARRVVERAAAQGLADVTYAPVEAPLGDLLLAATDRGLLRVAFPEEDVDSVLERIARRLSPRIIEAPAGLDRVRR